MRIINLLPAVILIQRRIDEETELDDLSTGATFGMLERDIHFEHVAFSYGNGRPVFRNLSLTIPCGKMTAIIGRSGIGKSILVARHEEPGLNFRLQNVVLRGVKNRRQIGQEFARMKVLLFPSEDEPCPNIPIEAITAGVPVCYNNSGGTPEIVRDSGEPLEQLQRMLANLPSYRAKCLTHRDLDFERVGRAYLTA